MNRLIQSIDDNKNKFLIFFLLLIIIFRFFNSEIKLEKPDEDFTWLNIMNFHNEKVTSVEKSSLNKLDLNVMTSKNYYELNYKILYLYNLLFTNLDKYFDLSAFGFDDINNNKLDTKEYKQKYLDDGYNDIRFIFANNTKIFEKTKFNFFNHYNYLYINNIIIFILFLLIFYKINQNVSYNFLFATLIFYLTPQINSFILFINSDYLTILLTPLLVLFLIQKKYILLILFLIFLQFFNRSTILISMSVFTYFLFIFLQSHKYYFKNIYLTFFLIIFLCLLVICYFLLQENYFKLFFESGFYYFYNLEFYELFKVFFKSFLIFIASTFYLDGQNSFLLNLFDYIIFLAIFIYYLFANKNKDYFQILFILIFMLFFIIFIFNGFDQFRHHPLIYFLILLTGSKHFNYNKIKNFNIFFIVYLLYANFKSIYLQYFIY